VEKKNRVADRLKDQDIRSDNRREYKSDLFLQLYYDESIERHLIVRETLQ